VSNRHCYWLAGRPLWFPDDDAQRCRGASPAKDGDEPKARVERRNKHGSAGEGKAVGAAESCRQRRRSKKQSQGWDGELGTRADCFDSGVVVRNGCGWREALAGGRRVSARLFRWLVPHDPRPD